MRVALRRTTYKGDNVFVPPLGSEPAHLERFDQSVCDADETSGFKADRYWCDLI